MSIFTNPPITWTADTVCDTNKLNQEVKEKMTDIDSKVVDKTTVQTLTNKTLTSPVINTGISGTVIATGAEVTAGTDNTKIVTPKAIGDALFFAGDLKPTARVSAPTGWLLCQGQAISRTTYAALFTAISTKYGVGDGSTTFNIPNLKGKVPIGLDSGDGDFNDRGNTGGEKTHTLITAEMPSHAHAHNHTVAVGYWPTANCAAGAIANSASAGPVTTSTNATSAGGGGAHQNLQPYVVINWLIKY